MYPWLMPYWQGWLDSVAQNRLAHASLLSGPQGLGKLTLARQMGHTLLCQHPSSSGACGLCHACTLLAHGHHPDLLQLGDSAEKSLGVDLIRELIGKLNGSPQLGGAKVVILARAERMTEAAANALLKTLEEPAGRSHLILLSDQPNRLLPTILSRCQKMPIRQPEIGPTLAWLHAQEGGASAGLPHLRLNQYAPLQTLSYLREGLDARRGALCGCFDAFLRSPEQLAPLVTLMLNEAPHAHSWLHTLMLDALKIQSGCSLDECVMSDVPDTISYLASFSSGRLLDALARWQSLAAEPEGMPSAMPSLHLTAWFNQLILEV